LENKLNENQQRLHAVSIRHDPELIDENFQQVVQVFNFRDVSVVLFSDA
jgi:hypothetical protein